jgi:hypothetical protein
MENNQLAGNVLDKLLGLNPGAPGTPEKIWKAVSQRFFEMEEKGLCVGVPVVDFTFIIERDEREGECVVITYNGDDLDLDEVKKDCAALGRLGFNVLQEHGS